MMTPKMSVLIHVSVMLLAMVCICGHASVESKDEVPSGGTVKTSVDLGYPASALAAKVQGAVVIKAMLDGEGNVEEVSALSGSRVLIPDCLSNAKRSTFWPVADRMGIIVYDFEIKKGECNDASRSLFQLLRPHLVLITACTALK